MKKEEIKHGDNTIAKRFGKKIEEWKEQFAPRAIGLLQVEDKCAILRPITAAELAHYSMMTAESTYGMDTASRYLLEELWLDGDNEIKEDDEYFMSAMLRIQSTIELKKSSFTKL